MNRERGPNKGGSEIELNDSNWTLDQAAPEADMPTHLSADMTQ